VSVGDVVSGGNVGGGSGAATARAALSSGAVAGISVVAIGAGVAVCGLIALRMRRARKPLASHAVVTAAAARSGVALTENPVAFAAIAASAVPSVAPAAEAGSLAGASQGSLPSADTVDPASGLRLRDGWRVVRDNDDVWFFCDATGESAWEAPTVSGAV
jgi:hypothetical protein